MAYNVGRRTREIGIRMALGAQGTSVMWLVMREVLVLLGAGVAIAIPAAWGLSRLVASQLYGITPNDPLGIFAATATIALVAAFAGYVRAFRATRIDPIRALRYEYLTGMPGIGGGHYVVARERVQRATHAR